MTKKIKVTLIGSPNVGKSVIFGCLTGTYVTVSNYPGTTVEVTRGTAAIGGIQFEMIDTPGLYSIFPVTEEERVTLDIIKDERPDILVHVIDAKNLERMLPLTFQLMNAGNRVILCLNMFDESLELGITIDTARLSELLGVPVVATVAVTKQGISQLQEEISKKAKVESKGEWQPPQFSDHLMRAWYARAKDITERVVKKRPARRGLSKLDNVLLSPITGLPLLAAFIYLGLYKFVGVLGAGTLVDVFNRLFEQHINLWLNAFSAAHVPWPWLGDLFFGEYGIVTLGFRYAFAIILPIVGLFFLVFAIMEDTGYLPRLAFLIDRIFKKIGLSGRAIIPMVLGLGCATMATMVTRTLPTKRERFIATLLLSLCIPCSAQIGVILGLLSGVPQVLAAWFGIIVTIFILVGSAASKLAPGTKPAFVIEIPPLRMPVVKNVVSKTVARMKWYFMEIMPLFIAASVIIWALKMTGSFAYLERTFAVPLAWMGLPSDAAKAFIFGFFRRDYGAAGLYDLNNSGAFTHNQLLVAIVVLTLFMPCITQFLITIKERGWKIGLGISAFVLAFSVGTGIALNHALTMFNIVF